MGLRASRRKPGTLLDLTTKVPRSSVCSVSGSLWSRKRSSPEYEPVPVLFRVLRGVHLVAGAPSTIVRGFSYASGTPFRTGLFEVVR